MCSLCVDRRASLIVEIIKQNHHWRCFISSTQGNGKASQPTGRARVKITLSVYRKMAFISVFPCQCFSWPTQGDVANPLVKNALLWQKSWLTGHLETSSAKRTAVGASQDWLCEQKIFDLPRPRALQFARDHEGLITVRLAKEDEP